MEQNKESNAIERSFEELDGVADFLARTRLAPSRAAIEATIASQRNTRVYEGGTEHDLHHEVRAADRWNGQPNSIA